ncbi:hypothetical protein GQR58_009204 [Nymphon striatum]|nr:hypothetical protein GQR58_009204 [Nymphon striatum]
MSIYYLLGSHSYDFIDPLLCGNISQQFNKQTTAIRITTVTTRLQDRNYKATTKQLLFLEVKENFSHNSRIDKILQTVKSVNLKYFTGNLVYKYGSKICSLLRHGVYRIDNQNVHDSLVMGNFKVKIPLCSGGFLNRAALCLPIGISLYSGVSA